MDGSESDGEGGYEPPYRVTPEIVRLVAAIGWAVGRIEATGGDRVQPALRRANRIRAVQGTVEIEGNTLTVEDVTAVLDGRRVRARSRELLEVRNAFAAYEAMPEWTPHSLADLLRAHHVLMDGLVDAPGRFRTGGVVVTGAKGVVHVAPPGPRVPSLTSDLSRWLEETDAHPLIASSVFHYEFEFVHPFTDGNGRMGRLWQTLILSRWKPLFAALPLESVIRDHRSAYYEALRESGDAGESTSFVEYALRMIHEVVFEHLRTEHD